MRVGISGVVALTAAVGTTVGLGTGIGIGSAAGTAVAVAVVFGLGLLVRETERAKLRDQAFIWVGPTADAHPIRHFGVRDSRGRTAESQLPKFVRRNVMEEVLEGLSDERFVIVKGARPSGKSRLIYEALSLNADRQVLISERTPMAGQADPLLTLMADDGGIPKSVEPQVVVLRDCVSRLIAGSITEGFIQRWLDKNPNVAIIATFNPADLGRIKDRSQETRAALARLERCARVVEVDRCLVGRELDEARGLFPALTEEQRESLPDFMSSGKALRDRFGNAKHAGHQLGYAIVCAVADWSRAGLESPAPDNYVRAAVPHYSGILSPEDYDDEIEWACQPVGASARLVERRDNGYVADWIVVDKREAEQGRRLPDHVWQAVYEVIVEGLAKRPAAEAVDDLISVGATALERGSREQGTRILKEAGELGDDTQRARIVHETATRSEPGSPQALVSARADDNVLQRLTAVQRLVDAPRLPANDTGERKAARWRRFIGWVYARRVARSVARVLVLALGDTVAVLFGLAAGLLVRATFDEGIDSFDLSDLWRYLPFWAAVALFFFALVGLYRQDSPRARLSSILLAAGMLGGVGLVTASAEDPRVGVVPASLAGAAVVAFISFRLRLRYDKWSRAWVRRNGLEAQTLLIGSSEEATTARVALEWVSRPTKVVGFITPDGAEPSNDSLGTVAELARVIRDQSVGRVVIVAREMPRTERQHIADLCHGHGLLVEAIPTLEDIQAGGAELVVGQSIVLMRIDPLWPGNRAFFVKRAFDIVGSSLGMVLLFPVWLAVLIAVAIEGRPIFVRSLRPGLGGKLFAMYKFRAVLSDGSRSKLDPNDGGALDHDITRLGYFLRKRGLDELPQLVNVFLGHMSLVGPRPLHLTDHAKLQPEHLRRYVVRPGVTGPWLVCDHTRLSYSELTELDVAYLRHWSIPADLDILAKTLRLMVSGRREFPTLTTDPPA